MYCDASDQRSLRFAVSCQVHTPQNIRFVRGTYVAGLAGEGWGRRKGGRDDDIAPAQLCRPGPTSRRRVCVFTQTDDHKIYPLKTSHLHHAYSWDGHQRLQLSPLEHLQDSRDVSVKQTCPTQINRGGRHQKRVENSVCKSPHMIPKKEGGQREKLLARGLGVMSDRREKHIR